MLGQLTERKWSATIAGRIQSRNHPSQFAGRTSAKKFWTSCDRVAGSQSATFSSDSDVMLVGDARRPKCELGSIRNIRAKARPKTFMWNSLKSFVTTLVVREVAVSAMLTTRNL